jgi:hypothetical protein
MMANWMIVVSGPQMLDDLRRATDDQVSFREAIAEVYCFGRLFHFKISH